MVDNSVEKVCVREYSVKVDVGSEVSLVLDGMFVVKMEEMRDRVVKMYDDDVVGKYIDVEMVSEDSVVVKIGNEWVVIGKVTVICSVIKELVVKIGGYLVSNDFVVVISFVFKTEVSSEYAVEVSFVKVVRVIGVELLMVESVESEYLVVKTGSSLRVEDITEVVVRIEGYSWVVISWKVIVDIIGSFVEIVNILVRVVKTGVFLKEIVEISVVVVKTGEIFVEV